MKQILLATALVAFVSASVLAQTTGPINITGTVQAIDTSSLELKTSDSGPVQHVNLGPNLLVVQSKPATLADIKPDDFVASAAVPGADHKLHSTELRIFPAAMRGVGEGQRPMNDPRGQTMTNATVTGTAIVNGSNQIKVKFQGGESELELDPGVPVSRFQVADRSLLRPGVKIRVQGSQTPDGPTATRVTIQ